MPTTTTHQPRTSEPVAPDAPPSTAALRDRFRPLFDSIATGAAHRTAR